MFQVNNTTSGGADGPGVDFLNFEINYSSGLTSGAAIRAVSGQCIRIDKIYFNNCPVAIAADNASQMSIFRCLGVYSTNTSPSGLAMVTVGTTGGGPGSTAVEVYMAACTWRAVPTGGSGLALFAIEHFRGQNCRVEGFQVGVSVQPPTGGGGLQATNLHFENFSVFTDSPTTGVGAAWLFKPQSGQTIQQVVLVNCEGHPGLSGGTSYTGGGFVFDASPWAESSTRCASCRATRPDGMVQGYG